MVAASATARGIVRTAPQVTVVVSAALLLAHAVAPAAAQPVSAASAGAPGSSRKVEEAIPESLSGAPGDAVRGRAIVASRQTGLCLLCHTGPIPEERFQGDLAPDLRGAGTRWSEGQLRLRLVDSRRINPDSIMPPYFRSSGLTRVAPLWQGKTALSAQQIEDVVAFLKTLRD